MIEVGARVCVKGRGSDSPIHRHVKVARITKTMIITDDGRRFRRDTSGSSIPYSPYGGTNVSAQCRKPKP